VKTSRKTTLTESTRATLTDEMERLTAMIPRDELEAMFVCLVNELPPYEHFPVLAMLARRCRANGYIKPKPIHAPGSGNRPEMQPLRFPSRGPRRVESIQ
jgi:hypothetical protein